MVCVAAKVENKPRLLSSTALLECCSSMLMTQHPFATWGTHRRTVELQPHSESVPALSFPPSSERPSDPAWPDWQGPTLSPGLSGVPWTPKV